MARKSRQDKDAEIITEALQRFDDAKRFDHDERLSARDDVAFAQVEGEQWDKRFRTNKERPKFQINRVQHSINQVIGEFVNNEIGTKVRPSSSEATEEVAETLNGLLRNIYNLSNFSKTQVEALKEVCNGGFGAWRVRTDFIDHQSFDQDCYVDWVPDALASVWFDPFDKDPLKRNSRYSFIIDDIPISQFRKEYPDATITSFERLPEYQRLRKSDWLTDNSVRVAEYFRKVPKKKRMLLMSDGRTYFYDDVKDILDEWEQERGIIVERERTVKHFDIQWVKMSGNEILEGPIKWPGTRHIPVVPVYGYHYWINGTFSFRGMVRFAKDAQRIYNYLTSAKIEAAANSPKDPIFVTPEQVGEFEDQYKHFNVRNTPFLMWNAEQGEPPPFRLGPPPVQQALMEQSQQADLDIQATIGRNAAALGNVGMTPGSTPSGAAINQVQHSSNVGQQEIFGNLSDAVQLTGSILVDLIPKIYDQDKQIRILKPDGSTEFVPINQETMDVQSGEMVMTNDLNQGKYDVTCTLGPTFSTQRQETLAMLQDLGNQNPAFMQATADLLVKALDHPLGDEIEKRIRQQMLKTGVVDPNEKEQKEIAEKQANTPPDPVEQMQFEGLKLQLQQQAAQVDFLEAQILKEQATAQKTLSEAENKEVDSATKLMDSITKQVEAGMQANLDAIQAMQTQLQQSQTVMTSDLPNQINEAFKRLAPGLYADEQGNVMEVDANGQVLPVNANQQLPDSPPPPSGVSIPGGGV